jgi:signal transduction histidine kinase
MKYRRLHSAARTAGILIFDRFLPLVAWTVDLLIWNGDTELRGGGHAPVWLIPLLSAAVYATLSLRRQRPVVAFAMQLGWAAAMSTGLENFGPLAGLLVALYAVSARCGLRRSAAAFLGCAAPLVIQNWRPGMPLHWQSLLGIFIGMLIVAAPWALGARDRTAKLREAASAEALRAERLRIARELHDIVAQAVSVMVLQAAGARAVLATDTRRAEDALDAIQEVGRQSTAELRRMLRLLRSTSIDDLPDTYDTPPGLDDLETLLERARRSGLAVSTQAEGTAGRLDPSVALTAYRLVQESLTNTLKHAGQNASVRVNLAWGPDLLTLTIEDHRVRRGPVDAIAAKLSTGHGLLGLHERVAIVGGALSTARLATGFLVQATLPVAGNNPSGTGLKR